MEEDAAPGQIYEHRGGGRYLVLHVAIDSTNATAGRPIVVYLSLDRRTVHTRTLEEWSELVDGRPRFWRVLEEPRIHVVFEGRPLCGFSSAVPGEWPAGHRWVRREDRALASCETCLARSLPRA